MDWMPGLPEPAGNPNIIGYQILVYDANAGESPQEFNVTVPGWKNSVSVSGQFLRWNTGYAIEVLAIEESNNQKITEGYFCTKPIPTSACEFPE